MKRQILKLLILIAKAVGFKEEEIQKATEESTNQGNSNPPHGGGSGSGGGYTKTSDVRKYYNGWIPNEAHINRNWNDEADLNTEGITNSDTYQPSNIHNEIVLS